MDYSAIESPTRTRKATATNTGFTGSSNDNSNDGKPRSRRRTAEQPSLPDESLQLVPMQVDRLGVTPLLSVPLEVIFRQVPSGKNNYNKATTKPLLTSAEARCLLSITMLAQELDESEQVAMEALNCRKWSRAFQMRLLKTYQATTNANNDNNNNNRNSNPFLRSLLPPLVVHGTMISNLALDRIMWEIARIMVELQGCANTLRQFSEQNWNIAESLWEAMGGEYESCDPKKESSGAILAREKHMLSDIQEEVCNRIESLIACGGNSGTDAAASNEEEEETETPSESQSGGGGVFDPSNLNNLQAGKPTTMAEYCARIMPFAGSSSTSKGPSSDTNNQRQLLDEQQQHRHREETQNASDLGGLEDSERNGGGTFSYGSNNTSQQQEKQQHHDARNNMVVEVVKEQRFTPAADHEDDDDITEAPWQHDDSQRLCQDDRYERKGGDSQLSKHESVRSVVSSESESSNPERPRRGARGEGETQANKQVALEALAMLAQSI